MMERIIYPVLQLIIIGGAFLLARFLAGKKVYKIPSIVSVLLIAVFPFVNNNPKAIELASHFRPSLFFFDYLIAWPAIVFLTLAYYNLKGNRSQRAIGIFTVFVFIYFIFTAGWFAWPWNDARPQTILDQNNYCLQSTDYTCAACSAVTLLKLNKIESTEAEMAERTFTVKARGASEIAIYYGLQDKLAALGRRAVLRAVSFEELKGFQRPVLVSIKYNFWLDHSLVILGYQNGSFEVADSLRGHDFINEAELKNKWLGLAIYIE